MSSKLIKQSLALFDDDLKEAVAKPTKKKSNSLTVLIGTQKHGMKKKLRKLQRLQKKNQETKRKLTLNDKHDIGIPDFTKRSVEALTRLSQINTDKNTSKVIFEHHLARKIRNLETTKEKESAKTVFTDKDFEDFEKEYDFEKK